MPAPDGPVAVVAGGGTPIGEAVAMRLEGLGFRVARVDAAPAGIEDAVRAVIDELGDPAVLVTAPGAREEAAFGSLAEQRWEALLDAHLGAVAGTCRAALPRMLAAGHGVVVFLVAPAARSAGPGDVYQAAAAGTLLGFAKSLAAEAAPHGVRVNAVAIPEPPGPGGRSAVADTVAFLVREGDFYVGQVFAPEGGD